MSVNEKMTAIADAIRGKTGKAEKLTLDQMPLEISSIVSGGGGDDSYNNPWVSYETAEIGIGENNVTNVEEAIEFMKSASGLDVVDDFDESDFACALNVRSTACTSVIAVDCD